MKFIFNPKGYLPKTIVNLFSNLGLSYLLSIMVLLFVDTLMHKIPLLLTLVVVTAFYLLLMLVGLRAVNYYNKRV